MDRRGFLGSTLAAAAASTTAAQAQSAPGPFKLLYGPRIGLMGGNMSVPQQLEAYHAAGFRAFEHNGLPGQSEEEIVAIRKKMDQLGMKMGTFVMSRGGWKPTSLPEKSQHKKFLEDCERAVKLHKIVENQCATVTTGLAVEHLTFAQQTQNCIEALKRGADIVGKTKLILVLEPLNWKVDHAGYFVQFGEHAAEIIGGVDHPNVKICWDVYHQQITEGNLINNINQYWDFIGYFQTGDVPGRKEPYTGEINYQNVFKMIHQKGYKGVIGLEHSQSVPGAEGFKKLTESYRKADAFEV